MLRIEGQVVGPDEPDDGLKEEEIVVSDPRKDRTIRVPHTLRPARTEFIELKYEVCIVIAVVISSCDFNPSN